MVIFILTVLLADHFPTIRRLYMIISKNGKILTAKLYFGNTVKNPRTTCGNLRPVQRVHWFELLNTQKNNDIFEQPSFLSMTANKQISSESSYSLPNSQRDNTGKNKQRRILVLKFQPSHKLAHKHAFKMHSLHIWLGAEDTDFECYDHAQCSHELCIVTRYAGTSVGLGGQQKSSGQLKYMEKKKLLPIMLPAVQQQCGPQK